MSVNPFSCLTWKTFQKGDLLTIIIKGEPVKGVGDDLKKKKKRLIVTLLKEEANLYCQLRPQLERHFLTDETISQKTYCWEGGR